MRLIAAQAEERDFQVLMSSHSRHIVDEADTLGANVVWFSDGQIQPGSFDQVNALMELGALDAGDRLRHGTTRLILLTEDERLSWVKFLIESSGFGPSEYDIWSYKGSSNIKAATILSAFVQSQAKDTKVVVHRDRDYLDDSEVATYEDDIRAGGAIPFITAGTDVESYYLNIHHLCQVYPEISAEKMQELLDLATSDVRDQSVKNMINARDAFRSVQRTAGIVPPSAGSIAAQAPVDFDADPVRFRHGKLTLKALQTRIQSTVGLNRHVDRLGRALEIEPFRSI
jgi:hypothetical protein